MANVDCEYLARAFAGGCYPDDEALQVRGFLHGDFQVVVGDNMHTPKAAADEGESIH